LKPGSSKGINPNRPIIPCMRATRETIAAFSRKNASEKKGLLLETRYAGMCTHLGAKDLRLGTSQKLYVSTNTICENNITDILFLHTFNLNSTCSARGNVSYLFFFLRDKHTTFYGRLHVLYVSTI
jgi:hypothetical protein